MLPLPPRNISEPSFLSSETHAHAHAHTDATRMTRAQGVADAHPHTNRQTPQGPCVPCVGCFVFVSVLSSESWGGGRVGKTRV